MRILINIKVFFHMLMWDYKNRDKWMGNSKYKRNARQREMRRFRIIAHQNMEARKYG